MTSLDRMIPTLVHIQTHLGGALKLDAAGSRPAACCSVSLTMPPG